MNLLWGTFSDLEGWLHGGRQENVTNSSYTNNLHHQLVSLAINSVKIITCTYYRRWTIFGPMRRLSCNFEMPKCWTEFKESLELVGASPWVDSWLRPPPTIPPSSQLDKNKSLPFISIFTGKQVRMQYLRP